MNRIPLKSDFILRYANYADYDITVIILSKCFLDILIGYIVCPTCAEGKTFLKDRTGWADVTPVMINDIHRLTIFIDS